MRLAILAAVVLAPQPVAAQRVDAPPTERAADVLARPVPVTAGDIGDRPYRVVGRVETFVGKPLWQKPPSEEKVFRELWERAAMRGADAVVNATYSNPQHELFRSQGGRQAAGDAIKFLSDEEAAALRGGEEAKP